MTDELFDIVFQGQIQADRELAHVKEQVGKIFSASGDKLEMLFSGKPVVIKKGADRATAEKYFQAMHKAGAVIHIRGQNGEAVDLARPSVSAAPAQEANTAKQTVAAPPAAPTDAHSEVLKRTKSFTSLSVAPLGEQLIPTKEFVPGKFNTEGMTMAPVGSDVTERQAPPAPFQANLDSLSMAAAGDRILDPNAPPAAETKGRKFIVDDGQ